VNSPLLGVNSSWLGVNSPLLGVNSPLMGVNSPLMGVNSPLLGVNSPLLGVNSSWLGVNSPLMGVNSPLLGVDSRLLGVLSPLLGVFLPMQVITTRLVNTPDNALQKGWGYHLDLIVIALYTGACSVLGLPWMTAATVPSLNHARSLRCTPSIIQQYTREVVAFGCSA
jgi:hypothetical protein